MRFGNLDLTDGCIIETANGNQYLWDEKQKKALGITTTGCLLAEEYDVNFEVVGRWKSIQDQFRIVKISKEGFTFWEREDGNESREESKSSDESGTETDGRKEIENPEQT